MDNDDPHSRPERAEEEDERGLVSDLFAHMDARRQADEARTRALLAALTAGFESEEPNDDNPDDLKEAA